MGEHYLEYFGSAHFTDNDSVGSHAQRLSNEIAKSNRSGALNVRLPAFKRYDVRMINPQLRDILNRDDAQVVRQRRK
jgi:hypothetical protein